MKIESFLNDDFYERRCYSEIKILDPKDLYESIVFMNVFLFQNGIPTKAQNWSCRPSWDNIGWKLTVEYTYTCERW